MDLSIVKRSINIAGRKIVIDIEDAFWISLDEIARVRAATTSSLIATINAGRDGADLSSAIRVYVLKYFVSQVQSLEGLDDAPNRSEQMPTVGPNCGIPRPRWLN